MASKTATRLESVAYGGKLDIRPPYQREFIYKDKQRDAVIDTVSKSFPLNVMYWAAREDGHFEVIDGQQRTLSICQYVNGDFSMNGLFGSDLTLAFHNLQDDQKKKILDYKLMVYFCSGTDSERLEWFRTINIAGVELTDQELRNAVYAGPWTADAKRYFSKTNCPAYGLASNFLRGSPIRQEYLETANRVIVVVGGVGRGVVGLVEDQILVALGKIQVSEPRRVAEAPPLLSMLVHPEAGNRPKAGCKIRLASTPWRRKSFDSAACLPPSCGRLLPWA